MKNKKFTPIKDIYLNREESINFLKSLDTPKEPTKKFIEGVRWHKKLITNTEKTDI